MQELRQALDKAAGYSCNHCQHRPRMCTPCCSLTLQSDRESGLPVPSFPFDDPALSLERAFINLKTEEELKRVRDSSLTTLVLPD